MRARFVGVAKVLMPFRLALMFGLMAAGLCAAVQLHAGAQQAATGSPALGLPAMGAASPDSAKAKLGRQLFVDARLSADGRMSCATCHVPRQGFTQNDRATADGSDGRPLRRNAPTLLNVGFARPLMHDGAAPSLEAQVLTPLLAAKEMANASFEDLEKRVAAVPAYTQAFREVFGDGPSMARIGEALAAYERTLTSGGSAFDRWHFGREAEALAPAAQRGFALFVGKAGCATCHTVGEADALFSDNGMHNTGIIGRAVPKPSGALAQSQSSKSATVDFAAAGDRGRHEVTGDPADLHRFRTPTLRNVALTAPYMHDGSLATLEDVVRFYNRGAGANADLDPAIKPLQLADAEIADLVAFLQSLTGSNVTELANEAEATAKSLP